MTDGPLPAHDRAKEAPMISVSLPDGRLDYRVCGPDNGPVVVFVHGFMVDGTLWGDVPDRLAERGYRCVVPTWPLGAHRTPMRPGADLSPRGLGALVIALLAELGLTDVTLVGNDTGGAICQFAVDTDPSRIGRLVLTNCDAFDTFPPFPFSLLFRLARYPRPARAVLAPMRWAALRHSPLGYGSLVRRRPSASDTLRWVTPYLSNREVRRDVAVFAAAIRPRDLADVATRLPSYERPVLLVWAVQDRFFRISLARRLARTFPDARLVEVTGARTFVPLDQPAQVADAIAAFASEDRCRPGVFTSSTKVERKSFSAVSRFR